MPPAAQQQNLIEALQTAQQLEQAGQTQKAIAAYEKVLATGIDIIGLHNRIFALKGFRLGNAPAANEKIFHQEALPALLRALAAGRYDQALELEALIYNCYVKQVETEEHYEQCFRQWAAPMERAGKAFAESLPPLLPLPEAGAGPLRIGFFFHNGAVLAHTEVILSYLEGLQALQQRPVEAYVYVFQSPKNRHDAAFDARFAAVGAPVHYLHDSLEAGGDTPTKRFFALRRLAEAHRLAAMVWVSNPLYLGFASAMRVAPLHIWYSLRFHPDVFSCVDGYIGGGSLLSETGAINGRMWRTAFIAYKDVYDPTLAPEAQKIRKDYQGKIILGTISRPEKLMGPDFLRALQRILSANPAAVFLWTTHHGNEIYKPLAEALEKLGIADRCRCIGWVEPALYAQVFDIYLDSFPSVSGMTAVQAMAAATPVVSVIAESMLGAYAWPFVRGRQGTAEQQKAVGDLFGGGLYLTCAGTADEYAAMAQKLIDQPEWRQKAGKAQQRFAHEYLCDRQGLARRLNKHFAAIVAEAQAA